MMAVLTAAIYFLTMFSWHAYLVSDKSSMGKRLAIQDGMVSLLGSADDIKKAEYMVNELENKPLSM